MKHLVFIGLFIFLILAPFSISPAFATPSATLRSNQELVSNLDYRRTLALYTFLDKFNSPLKFHAQVFVEQTNKYDLDYRLLVAIAGVESTFGREIPYNSYNAWGWGIYGNNIIRFSSYPEAIAVISKSLREDYINNWEAKNIYQMGQFYAASPTWAQRVVYFMGKIEDETLPLTL